MNDFESAFTALIGNEGGYVDNPKDPGGATRYGVTQRVARKHGYMGDMRELPLETARAIAKAEYWTPAGCDKLEAHVAFQVFDGAYNSGVAQSVKWLQAAVGATMDGRFGPQTQAMAAAKDPDDVCLMYDAARLLFLASLPTWPTFGRGWARRIAFNLQRAAS